MKTRFQLAFCVFITCSLGMLKAQPFLDKGKEIEKLIITYYDYGIFNGSILVADSSNILYKGILGFSDITTKNALSQETSFKINSLSKQFTAMGIVIHKEQGLLKYDNPLIDFSSVRLKLLNVL